MNKKLIKKGIALLLIIIFIIIMTYYPKEILTFLWKSLEIATKAFLKWLAYIAKHMH